MLSEMRQEIYTKLPGAMLLLDTRSERARTSFVSAPLLG
ncbi:hypothetical protein AGR4A_Lc40621 [Agrobacterium tumefaciens str. B6]|uniref:Uncharacterized protein n=1 Tax=Agrobacterium tumefaciens str. B6 TaxID=1183423 RepID=A0A822V7U2_AGRTU|nr:hypothetical protein AGR4A_Lc40621 [Agrobacterium tumefaciens str. B6]